MTKFKARVFIITLFCLLVCGGAVYYLLVVRFKEALRYLVTRESKGKYTFEASEANVSLWNKTIMLREAELHCVDTTGADTWYNVRIRELRFSIASWKDVLMDKKIILDSLSIIGPDIGIHVHTLLRSKDPPDFHASDILRYLEKTLLHFNVHSFSLQDASFTYELLNGPGPLHGDHISLAVSNFTHVNNEDSHLLGSDKISISMGKQHWVLPDGRQDISFNRLTFDSKGQRFELDSFAYSQKDTTGKGAITIQADKFFFNARHLPAIYQKEQLLLDTLICINPVLSIPGYNAGNEGKDSLRHARFNNNLFKLINVKFVAVIDGKLLLQDRNGRAENAAARKANVSIYNLAVDPAGSPSISSDSIGVNLRTIEFITKDSLYQLSIDEFAFHRNDAIFRNVRFTPRQPSPSGKEMVFTAPSLLLKDISIVDLLQRRLKASEGILDHPMIVMNDKGGRHATGPSPRKMALFYRALHHVSELMDTRDLRIVDGEASYVNRGITDLHASVKGIDAHILLNRFFVSDSLVDIKHAIPDLRIATMKLDAKTTHIQAEGFRFDGVRRHSWGERFTVMAAGGMELKGKNIYWNVFDWDIFQQTKEIQIDSLHIDELAIRRPRTGNRDPSARMRDTGGLPAIRIGRLGIDKTMYTDEKNKGLVYFTADDLVAAGLYSTRHHINWDDLRVALRDMDIQGQHTKTRVGRLSFDSNKGSLIEGVVYEDSDAGNKIRLTVPVIMLDVGWHSSDPGEMAIRALSFDDGTLTCLKLLKNDTLRIQAKMKMDGRKVDRGGSLIRFDELDLGLSNVVFSKRDMEVQLPQAALHLSNGRLAKDDKGRLTLTSVVGFTWKDGALAYKRDSTSVVVKGFSGVFRDEGFRLAPEIRPVLGQLIAAMTVNKADLHFKDRKVTVEIKGISWTPSGGILHCNDFNVQPNDSREETFRKAQWQGDYIFLRGHHLTLSGITFGAMPPDSMLRIHRVTLDGITLDASRDKRIPFRHGIERLMPTRLIDAIRRPFRIDTISLQDCSVRYNERSAATGKWSSIPIETINGDILNFGNWNNRRDTLQVSARALFFDGSIRHFSYREAYGDTLSGFSASSAISDLDLTRFSAVSVPAASVRIIGGRADTVFSRWSGNKYATYGTMHFYYDKLKIKVLNKDDSSKGGLMPALKTWLANLILPDKRKKASDIFMERDREKFVFNYWVKAQTSGLLSTLGVRRNAKYRKAYMRKYKQYSLPKEISSSRD